MQQRPANLPILGELPNLSIVRMFSSTIRDAPQEGLEDQRRRRHG